GIGNTLRARLPRSGGPDASGLVRTFTVTGAWVVGAGASIGFAGSIALEGVDSRLGAPHVAAVVALAVMAQIANSLLTDARFARGLYASGARWSAAGALAGVGGLVVSNIVCNTMGVLPSATLLTGSQYSAMVLVIGASAWFAFRA